MNIKNFPDDNEAKQSIIETGRRMYAKNFVAANDGNISCKVSDDLIWVTPTGASKGYMTENMLIKMRLSDRAVIEGVNKPSSEIKMHLRVYAENPAVRAVTHAHPPVGTSFAVAGIALDSAIYPEALVNLGKVPCARYETPGSDGVADSIAPYCKDRDCCALLLANHGVLTWGGSLEEAFFRMESLEHYATILMYTGRIIGKANVLTDEQVAELMEIRRKLNDNI